MDYIKCKRSITIIFSITTLFVLLLTLPAAATTLTVDRGIYGVNDVGITFGTHAFTTDAGELRVYFDGNSSSFLPAFCVDLAHSLSYEADNEVINILAPESYNSSTGLYAKWLMDSFSVQLGYKNSSIGTSSSYQGAGLQLAIWETFYDLYAPSRGTDLFYYNRNTVADDVNVWYDFFIQELVDEIGSGFNYASTRSYIVTELQNKNGVDVQDLMTVNPVPEPATMLLYGLGLLGISGICRRKNNFK